MITTQEVSLPEESTPVAGGGLTLAQRSLPGAAVAIVGVLAGGGAAGLLKTTGLPVLPRLAIGIAIGVAAAALYRWRVLADVCPQPPVRTTLFRREMIIKIDGIVAARDVLELEDFGPGYVVETSDGEHVYLASQILPDVDDQNRALGNHIQLRIAADSREILEFSAEGDPVPVRESVAVNELGVNEWVEFQILDRQSPSM